ncbi:MAG: GDYXXLXY domain-containing protein [Hoeflea sp.]|uniref:GDYXXLXY domain-containing protein n=1 Tax=Hoeflea sp. TaxID=1940281 RepID=UPI001E05B4F1|nr:GDYXXLXY domain-containing protein [Hoeflea sp.]MBU4530692.1 GDYXXLXY domain-containing protein [Alphaproteobacteria bacterium]MBU4544912.1 GDYXXLXY domain-containing protein [Alphaproteobacteria bacterium]MBU4552055.1 GDYXXLXY domain-containing protein [Alphaproteobacteria bacterium]MBV1722244.1 GDYXXLXY domain-containing protein [Hoeflea sp.]MBV1761806.1 GDYXXLXY domain-containing protein [Hoeflea sp.]
MTDLGQFLRRPLNPYLAGLVSAAVLVSTLALAIEGRASILREGREIVLKTEPVDPRDLMRGDYVWLSYVDVSTIDNSLVNDAWPAEDTTAPVWLTLAPGNDGTYAAKSAGFSKPASVAADEVFLKSLPTRIMIAKRTGGTNLIGPLSFGIERYYVPEGEGLEIEKAQNEGRTTVAVRVSGNGEPQIARLMIDGETLYQEPLY